MSHESILYGFIEGAGFTPPEYRKYQLLNLEVLQSLPEEDTYPYLARGMFSAPGFARPEGTFQAHVIHFGGSMNGLAFEDVPVWIEKFEGLLARLYWFEAAAHILTDYIDGAYTFRWFADSVIGGAYAAGTPQPTMHWRRVDSHVRRDVRAEPL